jgi:hypothetical protein
MGCNQQLTPSTAASMQQLLATRKQQAETARQQDSGQLKQALVDSFRTADGAHGVDSAVPHMAESEVTAEDVRFHGEDVPFACVFSNFSPDQRLRGVRLVQREGVRSARAWQTLTADGCCRAAFHTAPVEHSRRLCGRGLVLSGYPSSTQLLETSRARTLRV